MTGDRAVGGAALGALVAPFADPGPGQAGRLRDVPAAVAVAALEHLPADPAWTGAGPDLLSGAPSGAAVVGLWWD